MSGGRAGLVVAVGLLVLYLAATGKLPRIPAAWQVLNGGQPAGTTPAGSSALNPLPPAMTAPADLTSMVNGARAIFG